MLTENQKQQLFALAQQSKYREILIDAMRIWDKDNIQPVAQYLGITEKSGKYAVFKNECCLIGASICGKLCSIPQSSLFNHVTQKEIWDIAKGFDGTSETNDAEKFGKNVRDIIHPQDIHPNHKNKLIY